MAQKQRSFKVSIVGMFCSLLTLTVASILSFTYFKNREALIESVSQRFEAGSSAVIDKATSYMQSAQSLAEISTRLLEEPNINLDVDSNLESYLMEAVMIQPHVDLFYFGNESGQFLQAADLGYEIYSKSITRKDGQASTYFQYYDRDLNKTKTTLKEQEQYDPRKRPWYKGAKRTKSTYWSDPYIFFENGKPGITVAAPVYLKNDELKGVLGVDITLEGLSDFLKNMNLSPNSIAMIFDQDGQILAYPEPEKMMTVEDGEIRNVRPHELGIPWLTQAFRQYEDQKEPFFAYTEGHQKYLARFSPFPEYFGKDWTLAIMAPEDDFLGDTKAILQITLWISAGVFLVAILIGLALSKKLSNPIEVLSHEILEVGNFKLNNQIDIKTPIKEIQVMDTAISRMKNGLRAFQRYVPASLVQQLVVSGEDASLGGRDRELTIFFSDIDGFTAITEDTPPRDLMIQLSEYFDPIIRAIDEEKGTLDKFIGDAVMAFWGAPTINDDHAYYACRAALRCQEAIHKLNAIWIEKGLQPFETRIGLHTGYCIVGNIGSNDRMNYSVLGDTVNLAHRLEGVNKFYGTEIIISRSTYRYIKNNCICRILDQITVMGKTQSEQIYELLAEKTEDVPQELESFAETFNKAYQHYTQREWQAALELFEECLSFRSEDKPSLGYIKQCQNYLIRDPDKSWTPITKLDEK